MTSRSEDDAMQLFVDVETAPSQAPDALERVRAAVKPPATHKKAETIAAWWANEAPAAIDEAWRRQALDGGTDGQIISIALVGADEDDAGWVQCRAPGECEAQLLQAFVSEVQRRLDDTAVAGADGRAWPAEPWFIAHNAAFDLGFLWRRMRVHRVVPSFKIPNPCARAGKDFGCTMQAWAGYGGKVSLDTLCRVLAVPTSKGDLTGARVFDAWLLAGDLERIAAYNLGDAKACRDCWVEMHAWA
jgi:3'-5' exonuclease